MRSGWWRANRFWLPLVPLALVAMLAASSYRVKQFWYEDGLHHAVATATPGSYVAVDIPYTDTESRTAYRFRVRLDGFQRVTQVLGSDGDAVAVPSGATAYRVRMSFAADPSQALSACQLTLLDSRGRQYTADDVDLVSSLSCVPIEHPGPGVAFSKGMKRGHVEEGDERPARWTVAPVVLVPEGARPAEVRLWFDSGPDYVSLPGS